MTWFKNFSTRAKIVFSLGLIFLLLTVTIGISLYTIWTTKNSQREVVNEGFRQTIDLMKVHANMNRARALVLEMMLTPDRAKQQVLQQGIRELTTEDDQKIKELLRYYQSDQKNLPRLEELYSTLQAYRAGRDEQI
ncbi:MAG TPA: MCP four helix bundle domain-containing protein, partial [Desulfuromonadaceae bacterium]